MNNLKTIFANNIVQETQFLNYDIYTDDKGTSKLMNNQKTKRNISNYYTHGCTEREQGILERNNIDTFEKNMVFTNYPGFKDFDSGKILAKKFVDYHNNQQNCEKNEQLRYFETFGFDTRKIFVDPELEIYDFCVKKKRRF
jgi:hypothetical protein